jgi:hypothetical protein
MLRRFSTGELKAMFFSFYTPLSVITAEKSINRYDLPGSQADTSVAIEQNTCRSMSGSVEAGAIKSFLKTKIDLTLLPVVREPKLPGIQSDVLEFIRV